MDILTLSTEDFKQLIQKKDGWKQRQNIGFYKMASDNKVGLAIKESIYNKNIYIYYYEYFKFNPKDPSSFETYDKYWFIKNFYITDFKGALKRDLGLIISDSSFSHIDYSRYVDLTS